MPLARLPITGSDANTWSDILNRQITQTTSPINGAFNSFDTFAARPTTLTADDAGKTYLYTQTGNWHEWSGTKWKVQNKSEINVKDYGAIGDGVADDTVTIQKVLNDFDNVYFPNGYYNVSTLVLSKIAQGIRFSENAGLSAGSNSAQRCILEIRHRYLTITNLSIYGNFKTNYTSAIWWHSLPGVPAEYVNIFNLKINDSKIGILFGGLVGEAIVNMPQSENNIVGFITRGVERPIYANQPNGFLNVSNAVIDCGGFDWEANNPGKFDSSISKCIENHGAVLSFTNCELLKTQTQAGVGIYNKAGLSINNCQIEIASKQFLLGGGNTAISCIPNNYFANASIWPFELEPDTEGFLTINQFVLGKGAGAQNAAVGVINTRNNTNWEISISECIFRNQFNNAIFQSDYGFCTQCKVYLKNSYLKVDGQKSEKLSFGDSNLLSYYDSLDIAKFNVFADEGTSASIVNVSNPLFSKALELKSLTGKQAYAATKIGIDQSLKNNDRPQMLEFWLKSNVTTERFYGKILILYYDYGVLVGSYALADGSLGHILKDSAGLVDWKPNRYVLLALAKFTEIEIRFIASSYNQVMQIAGIRVF